MLFTAPSSTILLSSAVHNEQKCMTSSNRNIIYINNRIPVHILLHLYRGTTGENFFEGIFMRHWCSPVSYNFVQCSSSFVRHRRVHITTLASSKKFPHYLRAGAVQKYSLSVKLGRCSAHCTDSAVPWQWRIHVVRKVHDLDKNWLLRSDLDLWKHELSCTFCHVEISPDGRLLSPEAEFLDEIQTKVLGVSSFLFTALSWDLYFFKLMQPLTISRDQLLYM